MQTQTRGAAANDCHDVDEHRRREHAEKQAQQGDNGGSEQFPRHFHFDGKLVDEEGGAEDDGKETVEEGVHEEEHEGLHRSDADTVVDPPTVKQTSHSYGQWWSIRTMHRPHSLQWWARGGL